MKILVVAHKPAFPARDGGCIAMQSLLKALEAIPGAQLSVFSLYTHKHPKPELKELPPSISFQFSQVDTQLKPLIALGHFAINKNYNLARFYKANVSDELLAFAKEIEPDVVIFESLFSLVYINDLRINLSAATFIYRSHNIEFKIWQELARRSRGPKKLYLKQLWQSLQREEMFWSKQAAHILCISALDQAVYQSWGIKSSSVLWPSMEPKVKEVEPNEQAYHFGAMDWQPNLDAWEWFHNQVLPLIPLENLKVHLAGKGLDRSDQFEERVVNHGEVRSAEDFLSDKGICLVPLHTGSGIRIKVLEAACHGKALMATSKAVEGLDLIPGKHFILADKETDFAAGLVELVENKELRFELANNLHLWAIEKLSPSAQAKELASLFKQI